MTAAEMLHDVRRFRTRTPEAPREQCLAAIAGTLLTIQGARAWGGEYPRPVSVARIFRHPYQVNEVPHLIVVPDEGSRLGPCGHDRNLYEDQFRLAVYGYADGDDVVPPSTWIARLTFDVQRLLRQALDPDGVLAPLAPGLRFLEESIDAEEYRAAFTLRVVVVLRYALGMDL